VKERKKMSDFEKIKKNLKAGDYALATKFGDGDAGDPYGVGIVSEFDDMKERIFLEDENGQTLRIVGFRRAERVSRFEGEQLLNMMPFKPFPDGPSVWAYLSTLRGKKYIPKKDIFACDSE
jgi:hypothetical protein